MNHKLIFESTISCTPEELFAFHADTRNLCVVTPKEISVEILELEDPLKEGNQATLRIKKSIFSFVWKLRFDTVEEPNLIVDLALKSPFKLFRHEHHFIKINSKYTLLRDVVTFKLPLEPLSNMIVWFVKRDMKQMFQYRHAQTIKHFQK
ncbi:MAG: hypothetical protein RLZZ428_1041 [Pseudomonadota bacterium]|jgi:ligand-binding SRPBCC domain-containing protein